MVVTENALEMLAGVIFVKVPLWNYERWVASLGILLVKWSAFR
jgi:hypothetical protein